jgi:Leucine-rich repeat (LRR) protein
MVDTEIDQNNGTVSLAHNFLKELPPLHPSVSSLNLSCNYLKSFDCQVNLYSLQRLYLGANSLVEIPPSLAVSAPNLGMYVYKKTCIMLRTEELYLNNNSIKVTNSLSGFTKVIELHFF